MFWSNSSPFSGTLHSAGVNALDLINSTHLASGSDDQTAKVWDLTTGICTLTLNTLGADFVIDFLHRSRGASEIFWVCFGPFFFRPISA